MKKIGIIVEYNPLHNGHVYHFNSIPKDDDDITIAVMSGNVVNRGEVSVINKFDKASLALRMGVDLVIELPAVYTIQSGDVFAKRAIEILSYAGVSDIYIGSEENNEILYDKYYSYMKSNEYSNSLKKHLDTGASYKSASQNALGDANLMPLKSNDTLGLYYYKAIRDNNYRIALHTIKRTSDYASPLAAGDVVSATSIRLDQSNIKKQVPNYTYDLYQEKGFIDNTKIFNYLKLSIISQNLNDIFLIDEGFENTLYDVYKYDSYNKFIESINTKRYTVAKIERILLNILFNIKKEDMKNINDAKISFIRVLGYSNKGREYLKSIKKDKVIYTNIKEGINDILDIEIKISKILDVIYILDLMKREQMGPIEK